MWELMGVWGEKKGLKELKREKNSDGKNKSLGTPFLSENSDRRIGGTTRSSSNLAGKLHAIKTSR